MRLTRRDLLTSAVAGAAAGSLAAGQTPTPEPAPSGFDPWVEVHAAHLAHNLREVARVAGQPVLAVVKNNGYGLGVTTVARLLEPAREVAGFAVVKRQEAESLRDAGVAKPVLLMGPIGRSEILDLQRRRITPMVYTAVGDALEQAATRTGSAVPIHVCVDTGIGRVGVPHDRAEPLIRDLAARRGVRLDGVMMTFTEDLAFDREQLRRFETLTARLRADGLDLGRRHAASTYTLFQHPDAMLEMVRPGMALWGLYPEAAFAGQGRLELRPAVALRARVAYVKKLAAGTSAGYSRAFMATEDTWVATVPVGHADGWPRLAAKGATVAIGGRRYPVVASVSASHTIVDLGPGAEPPVGVGDIATCFDWTPGSRPEDVAAACGASVYDLTMHLGGHLPRRVV
ncbi:MAG: alanine racemase [Vicinamibacterales bacterium]